VTALVFIGPKSSRDKSAKICQKCVILGFHLETVQKFRIVILAIYVRSRFAAIVFMYRNLKGIEITAPPPKKNMMSYPPCSVLAHTKIFAVQATLVGF
jgi:hypothetical protein